MISSEIAFLCYELFLGFSESDDHFFSVGIGVFVDNNSLILYIGVILLLILFFIAHTIVYLVFII